MYGDLGSAGWRIDADGTVQKYILKPRQTKCFKSICTTPNAASERNQHLTVSMPSNGLL